MYLMYVDESGDTGLVNSPTHHFILSAIVVHESKWFLFLTELIRFRRELRKIKGLLMKEEIHAADFVSRRSKTSTKISPSNRLDILQKCLEWLSQQDYLSIMTVCVKKEAGKEPFLLAWTNLLLCFERMLGEQCFPNPAFTTDCGMVIADDTDNRKLTVLLRKMRQSDEVPNEEGPLKEGGRPPVQLIVKDPVFRSSANSYLLQMADVVAYFCKQLYDPAKYIRRKGGRSWYGKLAPVLNDKVGPGAGNYYIMEL